MDGICEAGQMTTQVKTKRHNIKGGLSDAQWYFVSNFDLKTLEKLCEGFEALSKTITHRSV
jgi:hypothetical protein